jgi:hypothetical protein
VYGCLGHRGGAPSADDEDDRLEAKRAVRRAPARGLYDEPRVGAPRTISDEQVEAILDSMRRFGLRVQQVHGQ